MPKQTIDLDDMKHELALTPRYDMAERLDELADLYPRHALELALFVVHLLLD